MKNHLNAEPRVKWAVVNTHPYKEQVALKNLAQQTFTCYCPLIRRRIRHARSSREVLRPLFPGYIFVQMSSETRRWQSILSTLGVRKLVLFGNRPGLLDDGFVECLRMRESQGAISQPEQPFAVGEQARLVGGAFDGLVVTILAMEESDRLVVLMDILNRSVKMTVRPQQLSAA